MNDLRNEQLNLFAAFEAAEAAAEQVIVKNYVRGLIDLKGYISNLFERYEQDGKLHYDDMISYNRLAKMTQEVRGITVGLYSENAKVISGSLQSGYTTGFTGQAEISKRAWGSQSLIGIIREDEMHRAMNNEISGLRWAKRLDLRREQAAAKIRETIVRGLHEGETYRQMAERLNEAVGKDVPGALRIVRTETYRVFAEARKDRLDRIKGINMTKEWITSLDERVRSNHAPMHGVKVPYNQDFILPNGNQGFAPGMIGDPKDDINCRCFYIVDSNDNAGEKSYTQGVDFNADGGIIDTKGDVVNTLPRYEQAVIPIEKFTKYALDPNHPSGKHKALLFKSALGYDQDNAYRLIANIRHNLPDYPSTPKGDTGHGMRYEVILNLTGPNGKSANVLTAWIDDKRKGEMRLTSVYITDKTGGQ